MKKVGLVGGLGPEATMMYYQKIIKGVQQSMGRLDVLPPITVESINMYHLFELIESHEPADTVAYLAKAVDHLKAAGADFGVMVGNTPHIVFDQLQGQTALPLLSMVQTACTAAQAQHLKHLGLLGTAFTMSNDFFKKPFLHADIAISVPDEATQHFVHEKIVAELENGIVKPDTKKEFMAIVAKMVTTQKIDGLVLGCTELPLLLNQSDFEIPVLDVAEIHIQQIVREILSSK